jgi:hypothetical protein
MKFTILALLLSSSSWAGEPLLKILKPTSKRISNQQVIKASNTRSSVTQHRRLEDPFRKLEEQNEKLITQLGQYQSNPAVWDYTIEVNFGTGSVLKGLLLNSVVSTNLESPMLVKVHPGQNLPEGTLLSCAGVTKYKRVMAACDRLIMPDSDIEYPIQVSLLNPDGSSGIKADYYYTGKEEYIAASIATSFARGVIELQTDRIATPLGQLTTNTSKNRLLNGVLGSTDEMNNLMKSEMQSKEPKAFIKAGKEVIVFFHERLKI